MQKVGMFWIALAAAMAPPPSPYSGDLRGLFETGDYPAQAVMLRQQGSVVARLIIDPAGKVETCTVVYSSHSSELDRTTCKILRGRAKFQPARNGSDAPIYSVVITPPITWNLDGAPDWRIAIKPDVELEISRAPEGSTLPVDVFVQYVVQADGKIGSCGASPRSSTNPAVLVALACEPSNLPPAPPVRNKAGSLVDAMYTSKVRFLPSKP